MDERKLVERLGYAPQSRLLIVNCDDLGSSHSANVATFRSMVYGVATSATLMVPCLWAREAARILKGFAVGVHLTLTSEYSGYRWRSLTNGASLHDDDGFFPATTEEALQRIDADEARVECRSQVETAISWGVDVTHLDTHMGVLHAGTGRDDLYEVYLDLAQDFRVPVRMSSRRQSAEQMLQARKRAQSRGVLFNERLVYPWPRRTRDVLFEEVPSLQPAVSEIFAHPVLDGEELRGYDTQNADIRTHDASCLIDPEVSYLLDQYNIIRISYRELRELQRAR
jgi:predicted glycoside hydrolase/deacetylase ChbG (UPF0249 family)